MALVSSMLVLAVCALWFIVFIGCFGPFLIGTLATMFVYYRHWRGFVSHELAVADVADDCLEPDFYDAESSELLPDPDGLDAVADLDDVDGSAVSDNDSLESTPNDATGGLTGISDLPEDLLVCVIWPMVTASAYIKSMACIRSVCRSWRHSAESTADFRDYRESWADYLIFRDRR